MSAWLTELHPLVRLTIYAVIVVGATMAAAVWPAVRRNHSHAAHNAIPLAAGVMLGAAFFHMLPEGVEGVGPMASYAVVLGFATMFLLERFVLVHACEMLPSAEEGAGAEPHVHLHTGEGCERHGTLGLTAFLGFTLHTLADGVALGAGVHAAGLGPVVLLAIVLHKIPLSFSLASVLRFEGRSMWKVLFMVGVFAAMVPFGAGLYLLAARYLEGVRHLSITPWALAFSAGTFLHVAFSDLFPEMYRRRVKALPALGFMALGLVLMFVLTRVVGHAGH